MTLAMIYNPANQNAFTIASQKEKEKVLFIILLKLLRPLDLIAPLDR
jgi:hypothetical protein